MDASTFGKNESLDLVLKLENGAELRLKATGATTMDLVQSLNRMLKNTEGTPLGELHETPGKVNYEETRQLFINNVLTESLTDGTPLYYNSNVLGRYYRKDYFDYDD